MKAADLQLRSVQVRFLHPDGQEERSLMGQLTPPMSLMETVRKQPQLYY